VANYPLTSGDDLWTDRAARAEVQLGRATARLGADTSFGVLNLDDHFGQFRLTQGSVALTVDDLSGDDSFEVDTPNGAVSLLRPGFYRIDVSEAGDLSTVTVRRGEAEIAAGDGRPIVLRDNESVRLAGLRQPARGHDGRERD
jgi:ferric-dicitrate binding protein FerR (iron transport regulator)